MPKVIINKEDFPPVNAKEKAYFVRYRIISEDRNRFSYWSPIFKIPLETTYVTQTPSTAFAAGVETVIWDSVEGLKEYDVWIKWTPDDWIYYGRVSNTFLTIARPVGKTGFSIRIYRTSEPIGNSSDYEYLKLYEKLD